jgi:hypothetical protein
MGKMSLFAFERRWLVSIFQAIFPNEPPASIRGEGQDDPFLARFLHSFFAGAPSQVRWGVRLAAWFITFYPLCWRLKCRTFHRLSAQDQEACLMSLGASRFYMIREIPMLLKIVSAMGIFGLPAQQTRLGAKIPDREPPAWFRNLEQGP